MIDLSKRKLHNLISNKKFSEILTGSFWALGARVISTGLAMVTTIIVARIYGADVLGIVAMINSFLTLATIFTVLGTNTAILRLIPEHITKYSVSSAFKVYRKTQFFVAGISIVSGGILFVASPLITTNFFSKPHLSSFFSLAAVFIVFKSLVLLNTQAVRGVKLIKTFAFMQVLPALTNLLVLTFITLFFFYKNNPVHALLTSLLVTAVVGIVMMECQFKKRMHPSDVIQDMPLKEILTLSWPMLMTATIQFVIGQTGVIMLGIYRPDAEVGYYAVAVRLATLTTFVLQAINSIAAPKYSELFHAGQMKELFYVARQSSRLIFWMTTPILIFLLTMGKAVLNGFFGHDFIVAYMALIFLVVGQFVNAVSGSTGLFMNMTGHERPLRNIILGAATINVISNLLLIPRYGINGASFSAMISLTFWNVYTLIYIKSKLGQLIGYIPFLMNGRK
jgi:O-antigen/teichoic acid export membrane protein